MRSFEHPMNILGALFSLAMAALAWRMAWLSGWDAPLVVVCLVGSIFVILSVAGLVRQKMMLVSAGVLGSAILLPTQWGLVPMVVGFVLFMLIIGLKLFEIIDKGTSSSGAEPGSAHEGTHKSGHTTRDKNAHSSQTTHRGKDQ